jgi:uncharacterized protein
VILADTNVLIGAFRAEARGHQVCRAWLETAITKREKLGLSSNILAAVIRITTNRRVFNPPSAISDAFGFCDDLITLPDATLLLPGPGHWSIFSELCSSTQAAGNLITDAWIAALAIEWNCEIITFDRDFALFKGLMLRMPTT